MPASGFKAPKQVTVCPVCSGDNTTWGGGKVLFSTHLKAIHNMTIIPGCSICWDAGSHYVSLKWSDVKGHNLTKHKLPHEATNSKPSYTTWFLTTSCSSVVGIQREDVCPCPLQGEAQESNWSRVLLQAMENHCPWLEQGPAANPADPLAEGEPSGRARGRSRSPARSSPGKLKGTAPKGKHQSTRLRSTSRDPLPADAAATKRVSTIACE